MSVYIHRKHKVCFICKKKISWWRGVFDWNYWDYEIGDSVYKYGIRYNFVEKYWHKKCAWNNRPATPDINE